MHLRKGVSRAKRRVSAKLVYKEDILRECANDSKGFLDEDKVEDKHLASGPQADKDSSFSAAGG